MKLQPGVDGRLRSCLTMATVGAFKFAGGALSGTPVAVLVIAWVLLGQALTPVQIAGALIVVGSIFVLGSAKG